jgi:hypothetical protein
VFDAPARISNTAARAACHALSCTLVLVDAGKCADGNRHAIRQARCSGHDIAQVDGGNAAGALQERAGAVWPGSKMIGRPIVSPGTRRSPGSHGMPIPVRFAASIGCGCRYLSTNSRFLVMLASAYVFRLIRRKGAVDTR